MIAFVQVLPKRGKKLRPGMSENKAAADYLKLNIHYIINKHNIWSNCSWFLIAKLFSNNR